MDMSIHYITINSQDICVMYLAELIETVLKILMVLLEKFRIGIRFQQTEMRQHYDLGKKSEESLANLISLLQQINSCLEEMGNLLLVSHKMDKVCSSKMKHIKPSQYPVQNICEE